MLGESFSVEDFTAVKNPQILCSSFKYLHSLDLLEPFNHNGRYTLTKAGRAVFKRAGGFLLLSSYNPYFVNLGNLLMGEEIAPTVDRRRNVLGSGSLHSKKFFPCVWEELADNPPAVLIDLGCGDGTFLELTCHEWPNVTVVASDMSPLAVQFAVSRLAKIGRPAGAGIVENAGSVESWVSQLPAALKSTCPCVVSIWFVAHEFSDGNPEKIVDFFRRVRSSLPCAQLFWPKSSPFLRTSWHRTMTFRSCRSSSSFTSFRIREFWAGRHGSGFCARFHINYPPNAGLMLSKIRMAHKSQAVSSGI